MLEILLIIGIVVVFVGFVFYKVFGPPIQVSEQEKQILGSGLTAPARVLSIQDTGNRQERHPEMRVTLEVQPGDGAPYRVEVVTTVSVNKLANMTPGSTVTVKYDPANPGDVAIVQ